MSDADIDHSEELQFLEDMKMRQQNLAILRKPFPDNLISKLPKPTCPADEYKKLPKATCRECGGYHATSKTIHLDYVGHAALTHRLLDADPFWSWEPLAYTETGLPRFDETGGLWIKLKVCGHSRIGYGHAASKSWSDIGSREKEVIGDALRNAAMRFGAALDLWHKGDLTLDDDDNVASPPVKKDLGKPMSGVKESQSPEMQAKLQLIADKVHDFMSESDIVNAVGIMEGNNLDAEQKIALWGMLDAPTRSAVKKYQAENTKAQNSAQQKTQSLRDAIK